MLEPRVLGQLLLMQSMVISLPDEKSIFAFVCRGLLDLPGVAAVRYAGSAREQSDAATVRIPLLVGEMRRGELWFTVSDPAAFAPYLDYLNNFCFMLAVILEERSQRNQKEALQSQLEERVHQRTSQLLESIAKRRASEEALRKSEEKFRDLFNNSEVAMFRTRLDGSEVLDVNRKFLELVGMTLEQTLGKPSAIHWADPKEREKMVRRLVADGSVSEFEFQTLNQQGGIRDCVTSLRLYPDQGVLVGSISDITERKRAEAALRESEEIFERFMENSPIYIFFKDENARVLRLSKNFEAMLGRPVAELLGKNMDELFPSELAKKMVADDMRILKEGRAFTVEEELDGRLYSTTKFPILAGQNRRYLAGYTIDITERRRAEKDRERLTLAIEQAGEAVLVTDAQGTIQYVNPMFETMTGYARSEVNGRNARLLRSDEQDDAHYRELEKAITSGSAWQGRLFNRRKDGSQFSAEMTIAPVRDEAGRLINFVAVERDVTEQLQAHDEKARLEDLLRQSQKVEAIGRLAGGVAHDFNNLTAVVLGYGELLLGRLTPEDPLRKYAEQIVAAGQRSAALTRQLLAFSRKQTLQPEVLDLNALLRNLEKMLGRVIGEDIELNLELAADLGRVTADPGQLEQVVTNLAVNARDAMPQGGRLTIETANMEFDESQPPGHADVAPGRYVLLSLTDTGSGMDKATMDRLFEPFFTTKPLGKGTGLGLATAYGIVKQSGGFIFAASVPDKGTTFKIFLPWTDEQPLAKAVEAGGEMPHGSGERILLVEDEASLRVLCETMLAQLGYGVLAAGSGPEALLLLQEKRFDPDLVLTDVIMPGMSGAEMARQLRSGRPGQRVLFMSGYPDEAIAPHGVLEPGTPFIQKPFSERALAAKVRDALRGFPVAGRAGRRVLMIDDDEQYRELVRYFCAKRDHDFAGVDSSAGVLAALAEKTFDVLLVDMNLPGTDGEQVLREIRAAGHTAPAIVLTGDVASADMDVLRPLGVVRALEKSSRAGPLLQAIEQAPTMSIELGDPPREGG